MKRRTLALAFLVFALAISFIPISDAQKIAIPCPSPLTKIENCPLTGCGPQVDPHLNRQKNIDDVSGDAEAKTLQDLRDLPDPVAGFKVGNTREKLTALGEGEKIRVVAFALVARKGSAESCNCKLTSVRDTENPACLSQPDKGQPAALNHGKRRGAKSPAHGAIVLRLGTLSRPSLSPA